MEIRNLDGYQVKAHRLRAQFVGQLLFAAVAAIDLAVRRIAHRIAVGGSHASRHPHRSRLETTADQRTEGHRGRTVRARMCSRVGAELAPCPAAEQNR